MIGRTWVFLCLLVTTACAPLVVATPPPTIVIETRAPEQGSAQAAAQVKTVAEKYLAAWGSDDYEVMYTLLTGVSRDAISQEEFTRQYQSITTEAALSQVKYELLSVLADAQKGQVRYRVTLTSRLVGDITRETVMNLRQEKGEWRIEWDDTLVMPELKGGNYLVMDRGNYIPSRANIYDRQGKALVAQADATTVGLRPAAA